MLYLNVIESKELPNLLIVVFPFLPISIDLNRVRKLSPAINKPDNNSLRAHEQNVPTTKKGKLRLILHLLKGRLLQLQHQHLILLIRL